MCLCVNGKAWAKVLRLLISGSPLLCWSHHWAISHCLCVRCRWVHVNSTWMAKASYRHTMESNAKSFSAFSSTGTNLASPHRHQLAIQCPNTYKHTFIQHTKLYRLKENVQLIFYFHSFFPSTNYTFFPVFCLFDGNFSFAFFSPTFTTSENHYHNQKTLRPFSDTGSIL